MVLDTVNPLPEPLPSLKVTRPQLLLAIEMFNRAVTPAGLRLVDSATAGRLVETPPVDLARVQWDG